MDANIRSQSHLHDAQQRSILFAPHKDVAAVRTTDDILMASPEEIHSLHKKKTLNNETRKVLQSTLNSTHTHARTYTCMFTCKYIIVHTLQLSGHLDEDNFMHSYVQHKP